MTYRQVMTELRKCGTAQTVRIYRRHGAHGDLFGVSFADLNKLKKKIKTDHELAVLLWDSGNVDARTLATMIADPTAYKSSDLDRMVKAVDYYLIGDLFSGLVTRSSFASAKVKKWTKSNKEFVRQCGYNVLASALKLDVDLAESDCRAFLKTIESEIHASPNRARHSMNMALIAIGVYRPKLTKAAIAASKRIGQVEVDHGETSCQTPEAVAYIEKTLKHRKKT